jgi:hypothetical protein
LTWLSKGLYTEVGLYEQMHIDAFAKKPRTLSASNIHDLRHAEPSVANTRHSKTICFAGKNMTIPQSAWYFSPSGHREIAVL